MSTATLSTSPLTPQMQVHAHPRRLRAALKSGVRDASLLLLFALLACTLLGYHPFAEDGGIYAAAVAAQADPSLYPHDHLWVDAHTRYGQFVRMAGALVTVTGSSVEVVLCALQFCGIVLLLAAALHLARTCFGKGAASWWAVGSLAVCVGLPVAGTSLYAADPYCSARTLCTPLLLFACSLQLRQRFAVIAPLLVLAACMHPLMAAWGCLPVLFLGALRQPRPWRASACVCVVLIAVAAALYRVSTPDTPLVHLLSHSRGYWYLSQWHWYEWFGAAAPPAILLAITRKQPRHSPLQLLARVTAWTSALAILLALLFCRMDAPTSVLARLQPLRALHLVFLLFLIVAAGRCATLLQTRSRQYLAVAVLMLAAASLWSMQRSLYSTTRRFEFPGLSSGNDWLNAFQWVRSHTDRKALFALDADYITARNNDAHGFRAAAQRSALPDRAKDGGIASVMPELAPTWAKGVALTNHLTPPLTPERTEQLKRLGVNWVVFEKQGSYEVPCPFQNATVAVCHLP